MFIPFFIFYLLIDVNFKAFSWIDNHRNSHKPMQVKLKVKKENVGKSMVLDDNEEEIEKVNVRVVPSLPTLLTIFS